MTTNLSTMAYNKATDLLFFLHNPGGPADLHRYDPKTGSDTMKTTVPVIPSLSALVSGEGEILYTASYYGGNRQGYSFVIYDADPLRYVASLRGAIDPSAMFDLEVSPADSDILAFSSRGPLYTRVQKGTNYYRVPQGHTGRLEFSENGTELYLLTSDCRLEAYQLRDGVEPLFLNVYTSAPCSDFEVASGRLFFDDGTVFDVGTGQRVVPDLALFDPKLVAVSSPSTVHLLTRTNNAWGVHRFRATTLELLDSAEIDSINGVPFEFISVGPDRAAIRTENEIVVVTFPSNDGSSLRVVRDSATRLNISFPRHVEGHYQLQTSSDLRNWNTEQTIPGADSEWTGTIEIAGSSRFYRLLVN